MEGNKETRLFSDDFLKNIDLNWKDFVGKKISIKEHTDEFGTIIVGIVEEDGKILVLDTNIKKEK